MGLKPEDPDYGVIWLRIAGVGKGINPALPGPWNKTVECFTVGPFRYGWTDGINSAEIQITESGIFVMASLFGGDPPQGWREFIGYKTDVSPPVPGSMPNAFQYPQPDFIGGTATYWWGSKASTPGSADEIRAALLIPDDGQSRFEISGGDDGKPSIRIARKKKDFCVYIKGT